MYEDFHVSDRWSGEDLHCRWKGTIVAIATRHADAVDVRYDVNGRPMWIALVEEGYDSRREIYTMTVAEVLDHLDAVVAEAKDFGAMPTLPVIA